MRTFILVEGTEDPEILRAVHEAAPYATVFSLRPGHNVDEVLAKAHQLMEQEGEDEDRD